MRYKRIKRETSEMEKAIGLQIQISIRKIVFKISRPSFFLTVTAKGFIFISFFVRDITN